MVCLSGLTRVSSALSYDLMHSCWSPVPKCRPSFQHLLDQLEALWLSLSPGPPLKEPLLYVNLEGDEACQAGDPAPAWGVPWQRPVDEDTDWLMVGSGAALAIGGDYRYIIGPRGAAEGGEEEEEGAGGRDAVREDERDDEDDAVIHV